MWCHAGSEEAAGKALKPMRQFGKPVFDHVGPMPFPVLQSLFDGLYPPGLQWYWKANFVKELSQKSIDLRVEHEFQASHHALHRASLSDQRRRGPRRQR